MPITRWLATAWKAIGDVGVGSDAGPHSSFRVPGDGMCWNGRPGSMRFGAELPACIAAAHPPSRHPGLDPGSRFLIMLRADDLSIGIKMLQLRVRPCLCSCEGWIPARVSDFFSFSFLSA